MQIADPIRNELSPGEQVVWSGQPRQGIVVRGADAFTIPFSLVWAGFSVFWVITAAESGAPLPFVLFGVPFVLVGIYLVIGRFFVEAWQRKRTFYALTPERVIIASGRFSRKVKSVNLKGLAELEFSERPDGTGTISFGPQPDVMARNGRRSPLPLGPRFDLIPQARSVYEAVRKAQAAAH